MMHTDAGSLAATQEALAALDEPGAHPERPELELVRFLCQALLLNGVSYCHWKSNDALDRSASGENDLDLLVEASQHTNVARSSWRGC